MIHVSSYAEVTKTQLEDGDPWAQSQQWLWGDGLCEPQGCKQATGPPIGQPMLTSIPASAGVRVRPPTGGQNPRLSGRCGAAACFLVGLRETNTVISMLRAGETAVQRDLGQRGSCREGLTAQGLQHISIWSHLSRTKLTYSGESSGNWEL